MTSSSHAERLRRAALRGISGALLAAACAACAAAGETRPYDAPRPARDTTALAARVETAQLQNGPVELREMSVARVRSDTGLSMLAGRVRLDRAPDLVALTVETLEPIPPVARDAALEIYLDGQRTETRVVLPNRLIAFVEDVRLLREGAVVTAAWTGAEEETRSRRGLVLTAERLQRIR